MTNARGKEEAAADVLGAFSKLTAATVDAGTGHDAKEKRHRRVGALDLAATINGIAMHYWNCTH